MSWNIQKPGDFINGPLTVTGNLTVDTNTLFVDAANNRVGVGTVSPAYKFVIAALTGDGLQFENTSDFNRGGRITSTGTAGTGKFGITTTSSGYGLSFGIDGFEKMLLDTNGNVGVGVTPSAWSGISGKVIEFGSSASNNSIWGNGVNDLHLVSNSFFNGSSWIYNKTASATRYNQLTGAHVWYNAVSGTAGNAVTWVQALTLNSNGALVLQGGNTVANGVGITFPSAQSASTDANTLDDYEEGTFTPTIEGTSTAGTATYSTQVGRYTKIGRLVSISIRVAYSAGNGTGNLRIAGLPFVTGSGNVWTVYAENIAMTAGNSAAGSSASGVSTISIDQLPAGGGAAASVTYDGAGDIQISGTYTV
jgi:hypothetical protein